MYILFNVIMMLKRTYIFILICVCLGMSVFSQPKINYDEEKIDLYELPDLLTLENGQKIQSIKEWENKRKTEIINLYKNEVYGRIPGRKLIPPTIEIIEQSDSALDDIAIRKQIALVYTAPGKELAINVLLYLPKDIKYPPIFMGYNFYGNHTTINDQNVILTSSWVRNNSNFGITNNKPTEESRGKRNYRWPIKKILSEGFGIATIYYGDIDPDRNDFSDGIHPFFYTEGQNEPNDDEWGSISAWAWGISRVMDYLETDELLINSKFILFGHSRLGKTSLWAGALDTRFDIVISNDSGCGGAAIFRRKYGETAAIINVNFPHWFSKNFKKYSNNENLLPVDQHMLIALIAPRPVYIASAEDDRWADPKGEFLSGYHAGPVYELYEKKGLTSSTLPTTNVPIHNTIGYHIRTGKHDVTDYDWEQFMIFANKHFKNETNLTN